MSKIDDVRINYLLSMKQNSVVAETMATGGALIQRQFDMRVFLQLSQAAR